MLPRSSQSARLYWQNTRSPDFGTNNTKKDGVDPGENPTIGILICKQRDEALVELSLPKDSNIYAKEYKLYLPDKKLLKEKLQEWIDEAEG